MPAKPVSALGEPGQRIVMLGEFAAGNLQLGLDHVEIWRQSSVASGTLTECGAGVMEPNSQLRDFVNVLPPPVLEPFAEVEDEPLVAGEGT
ncbi:MAG TPA: hypothetical protein VFH54_09615 [Mycobacteriales bacterium]|nr:hypothetical protein [Mycobacteriales bacterium]